MRWGPTTKEKDNAPLGRVSGVQQQRVRQRDAERALKNGAEAADCERREARVLGEIVIWIEMRTSDAVDRVHNEGDVRPDGARS